METTVLKAILLMINGTPVSMLVDELGKALARYNSTPNPDTLAQLQFACFKLFEKGMIDSGGGVEKVIQNMENGFKFQDAFKHFKNVQ